MNNRFPALNLYKSILTLLGYLVIGGGVLLSISSASSSRFDGFDFGQFLLGVIVFGLSGLGLLVVAELIAVLLNIEAYLYESRSYLRTMRDTLQKQNPPPNR